MSDHYHAVVWIDHHEARVFHFNVLEVDHLVLHPHEPTRHIHHKANSAAVSVDWLLARIQHVQDQFVAFGDQLSALLAARAGPVARTSPDQSSQSIKRSSCL